MTLNPKSTPESQGHEIGGLQGVEFYNFRVWGPRPHQNGKSVLSKFQGGD